MDRRVLVLHSAVYTFMVAASNQGVDIIVRDKLPMMPVPPSEPQPRDWYRKFEKRARR